MYDDQRGYYYSFRDTKKGDMTTRYSYVHSVITAEAVYIGIGQSSPWLIDCVAPSVNPITKYPLELIVKASTVKPARRPISSTAPEDIHKVNNIPFILLPDDVLIDITVDALIERNAKLVYIELEIPNKQHTFSNFRHLCYVESFNLVDNVEEGAAYYTKNQFTDYTPVYMENFSPIPVQNRVRQTLQILMEI